MKHRASTKGMTAGLAALAFITVLAQPAPAYPRPGRTERVSVASDGTQGNDNSWCYYPSMSADGRYVAFHSFASTLVPGDTNGAADVFVRDRETGVTARVSVSSAGTQANQNLSSYYPSISADGRYVAFYSYASNLVAGDTNARVDVFVRDREAGVTERVSVASNGTQANGFATFFPSISADGRYVAFYSDATNLVPGDTNAAQDVFVHDRATGVTEGISLASDGTQGNGHSASPSISADGRYVAFMSAASNLVPGDTNASFGANDVFVYDRETGVTERASVASDGTEANGGSQYPSISADGRYVTFVNDASNLVPADTNIAFDAFVHDLKSGSTERVSVASDGAQYENAHWPSISADGRYVAFVTYVATPQPLDPNVDYVVRVRDRETGATERVSVASDGTEGNGPSYHSSISGDGRYVAFEGVASNLTPGDTNARQDVFVRDRGPAVGVGGMTPTLEGGVVSVSGWATFSGAAVASVADPPGDGDLEGRDIGADLLGASVIYRPEDEDLLVRLRLASLPGPLVGGAPGVLYALRFQMGSVYHEVRALRAGGTAAPPAAPYFALYRCDPDCIQTALLTGGIGTARAEVLVSVPLSVLGAQEGAALSAVRAFTALGEAAPGLVVVLDDADLPDATIPWRSAALGIAPAGTPEDKVAFDTTAALSAGTLSGTLAAPSSGDYEVWARACLGVVCGETSTPVRA